jgi:hypothetical protein
VGAAASALLETVDTLAGAQAWRCSEGDLGRLVQTLEVAQRRLDLVAAHAAVDAFDRGLPATAGFTTTGAGPEAKVRSIAGWLRSLVNISPFQARHRAKAAVALLADPGLSPQLAETRAAAERGQISTAHAVVIADTVRTLSPPRTPTDVVDDATRADVEHVLVAHACVLDPAQTRAVANRAIAVLDPDAGDRLAHDEDARDQLRGLTLARQSSGLVHLTGTLTPDCAGVLATAIDAASAPRPATDGTRDTRTPAMRRHDALAHVLGQVVAADRLLPSTHGSPYRLVVTVPHATLTAALTRTHRPGRDWNPPAPAAPPPAPQPAPQPAPTPGAARRSGRPPSPDRCSRGCCPTGGPSPR